ncbi:hypothetical protein [Paenibacillus sp. 23TSA30-6]|uniref:hypothetical protein n=1 Tax=Paenibacillus sp. 23TSA30-6 TaxID=2546104 RepID=UPI001EE17762|nr:hypothetical protein [Paenibacillus sp. 23TSA30-6]
MRTLEIAVLLHGIMSHFRLQMLPTYLVAWILIIGFILRITRNPSKVRMYCLPSPSLNRRGNMPLAPFRSI